MRLRSAHSALVVLAVLLTHGMAYGQKDEVTHDPATNTTGRRRLTSAPPYPGEEAFVHPSQYNYCCILAAQSGSVFVNNALRVSCAAGATPTSCKVSDSLGPLQV
jgi:hypothetical protein